MKPTVQLVYKTKGSPVSYINDAIDFIKSKGVEVNSFCEFKTVDSLKKPKVIFILTSQSNSSYINKDQFAIINNSTDIPVFLIYQLKNTTEFWIYKTDIRTENISDDKYAFLSNFTRIKESELQNILFKKENDNDSINLGPFEPNRLDLSFLKDEDINELLLLIE